MNLLLPFDFSLFSPSPYFLSFTAWLPAYCEVCYVGFSPQPHLSPPLRSSSILLLCPHVLKDCCSALRKDPCASEEFLLALLPVSPCLAATALHWVTALCTQVGGGGSLLAFFSVPSLQHAAALQLGKTCVVDGVDVVNSRSLELLVKTYRERVRVWNQIFSVNGASLD